MWRVGVIISVEVVWDNIVIIEYDRRRPGLSSAPVDMEYDNSSKEQEPPKDKDKSWYPHVHGSSMPTIEIDNDVRHDLQRTDGSVFKFLRFEKVQRF